MSVAHVVVPPGQHPPLATITPTDHSAYIIITTAVAFSITLLFLGVRVFVRSMASPGWSLDDLLVAGATVLAFLQFILVSVACHQGLGKIAQVLQPDTLAEVQRLVYGSNILSILAVGLSRGALMYFSLRLTPVKKQKLYLQALLGCNVAWTVASTFAVALTCDLTRPWVLAGQSCPGFFLRWEVVDILGCALEVALFCSAVWLTWELQVSREKKGSVLLAFGCRLGMIVLAALRIRSFNRDALTSDPTFSLAEFLCWTSAELNYSILSATLPIVRPLISNLATHYGGGFGQSDGRTYADGSTGSYVRSGARGDSKSDTIQLRSMGRNRGDGSMRQSAVRRSRGEDWGHDKAFGRAGRAAVATGEHSNQDAVSVESSDSQRMIIRKDVTWVVDHDHESMGG